VLLIDVSKMALKSLVTFFSRIRLRAAYHYIKGEEVLGN
jgi:hypothetical protein